jgi:hypothetical protein
MAKKNNNESSEYTLEWIAKTIGHCRSIKSQSNDCWSNDCRSIECRSNDIIP